MLSPQLHRLPIPLHRTTHSDSTIIYVACTYSNSFILLDLSADTYFVFREQQLHARVRVTTILDPPLPQQTVTTLAPFSALPTSIQKHSLVSLPFSSSSLLILVTGEKKNILRREG